MKLKLKRIVCSPGRFLLAVAVFIIFLLKNVQYLLPTTETLLLAVFSPAGPPDEVSTVCLIGWIIVCTLFLFTVGDYFLKSLQISYVYIFPRIGTKRKWLKKQTIYLLVQTLLFWTIIFMIAFLAAGASGLPITENALFYIELYIMTVITAFFIAFLENILVLKFGMTTAFFSVFAVWIGVICFGIFSYEVNPLDGWLFSMLPPLNTMLQWHTDATVSATVRDGIFSYAPVPEFSLWKSCLFTLGYFFALYGGFYMDIEKRDSMDFIKEAL